MLTEENMQALREIVGAEHVHEQEPLAAHTTFKIGGPAEVLVEPGSIDEVQRIVRLCHEQSLPWRVIGFGSDLLVSDTGVEGIIIKIAERLSRIHVNRNKLMVQAGASNKDVALAACETKLSGYEFAHGIPGSVGGAAIMNAGAYDGEFKQVCTSVICITETGEVKKYSNEEAAWGYRTSRMAQEHVVIVEAMLELIPGKKRSEIQSKIDELWERRISKQPLEYPSAGSTFKRPEGYFAGKLIQDAGLRGARIGGAQVSEKHTGFVINTGDATAEDVQNLIAHIQKTVYETFGVAMQTEVKLWGFETQDANTQTSSDAKGN